MFGRLRDVALNAKNLKLKAMAGEIFSNGILQGQVLDLNTHRQLYEQGVDARGRTLGDYAPATIQYKSTEARVLGRDTRADHITLKDTGDFYRSFKFKNRADGFIISADANKQSQDLVQRFGSILGLTNDSIKEILPEVIVSLRPLVRESIVA